MQNFGKIKNAFNDILAEAIVRKDPKGKALFQKYLKMLKESKILKTQFLVYNELEKKISDDSFSANIFLSENVKLLDKFTKKDIIAENEKLVNLSDKLAQLIKENYAQKDLHESISNIIFNSGNPSVLTESRMNIINYMKENKVIEHKEAIELPISMISNAMVSRFNEKYSTIDESEKKILRAMISSDDNGKIEIYTSLVKECISAVNESLKGEDLNSEIKERLLAVKERLLESTAIVDDSFNTNVSKLIELKKSLTE